MVNHTWDFDEEAEAWALKHRTPDSDREDLHMPKNCYAIELASRRGRVKLDREEWKTLQRFLDANCRKDLRPEDYRHLPAKVRLVVHDWVNC